MKWKKENKCLSDEILQQYIDEELTNEQMRNVETHLSTCESCKLAMEEKKSIIEQLKFALENVEREEIIIPEFDNKTLEIRNSEKHKKLVWWAAASMVLILISVFIFDKPEKVTINLEFVYREMQSEIDANKPWHEQNSTIYILNESGEIIDKI